MDYLKAARKNESLTPVEIKPCQPSLCQPPELVFPNLLKQDCLRSKWRRLEIINSFGLLVKNDYALPPMSAQDVQIVAGFVNSHKVHVESHETEIFWSTVLSLQNVISCLIPLAPEDRGEIALVGSVVKRLISGYIHRTMSSLGFITPSDPRLQEEPIGDVDVRLFVRGVTEKKDLRKRITPLSKELERRIPPNLVSRHVADELAKRYPQKYPAGIRDDQIGQAIVGNTAFRKLNTVQEYHHSGNLKQFFMTVTLGNDRDPPLDIVIANKLQAFSLFYLDDLRLDIGDFLASNPYSAGIFLRSSTGQQGILQSFVDYLTKRLRITNIDTCDAMAFFRYHLAGCKGYLYDDPVTVERDLVRKVQDLDEIEFANTLHRAVMNHMSKHPLSTLLLTLCSLSQTEKYGIQHCQEKILGKVLSFSQHLPQAGSSVEALLFTALFTKKISPRRIMAALQLSSFFHLFTNAQEPGKICAFLTESSGVLAYQMQFVTGHTLVFPYEMDQDCLSLAQDEDLKPLLRACLPKAPYPEAAQRQITAFEHSVKNPNFSHMAKALTKYAPLAAFHCLLLHSSRSETALLDLFFTLWEEEDGEGRGQLISQLTEYCSQNRLEPKWSLAPTLSEEGLLLEIAKSGIESFRHYLYHRVKDKNFSPFSRALFTQLLKEDHSLAIRFRVSLQQKEGFTKEIALQTFSEMVPIVLQKDIHGLHHDLLLAQGEEAAHLLSLGQQVPTSFSSLLAMEKPGNRKILSILLSKQVRFTKSEKPFCQALLDEHIAKQDWSFVVSLLPQLERCNIRLEAPKMDGFLLKQAHKAILDKEDSLALHLLCQLNILSMEAISLFEQLYKRNELKVIIALLDSNNREMQKLAVELWKRQKDGAVARELISRLPKDWKEERMAISISHVQETKKGKRCDPAAINILSERLPERGALLLAILKNISEADRFPEVHAALRELSDIALAAGNEPQAVAFWKAAAAAHISVIPYITKQVKPDLTFVNLLLNEHLLTRLQAIENLKKHLPPTEKVTKRLIELVLELAKEPAAQKVSLDREVDTHCNAYLSSLLKQSKLAEANELLLAMRTLKVRVALVGGSILVPFVRAFPEFAPELAPFLPITEAFPYLSTQEKTKALLEQKESGLASYAQEVAAQLVSEKQMACAYRIHKKYGIKNSDELEKILLALCQSDSNLVLTIILDKSFLQGSLTQSSFVKVLSELLLSCKDYKVLAQALDLWNPLLPSLNQEMRLSLSLRILASDSKEGCFSLKVKLKETLLFFSHRHIPQPIEQQFFPLVNNLLKQISKQEVKQRGFYKREFIDVCAAMSTVSHLPIDFFQAAMSLVQMDEENSNTLLLLQLLKLACTQKIQENFTTAQRTECDRYLSRLVKTRDDPVRKSLFTLFDAQKNCDYNLFKSKKNYSHNLLEFLSQQYLQILEQKSVKADTQNALFNLLVRNLELLLLQQEKCKKLFKSIYMILFYSTLSSDQGVVSAISQSRSLYVQYLEAITNMGYKSPNKEKEGATYLIELLSCFLAMLQVEKVQEREGTTRVLQFISTSLDDCADLIALHFPVETEQVLYGFLMTCLRSKTAAWITYGSRLIGYFALKKYINNPVRLQALSTEVQGLLRFVENSQTKN